jgi:hypothetical protein
MDATHISFRRHMATERMCVHTLVPGPTRFQNTAAVAMFVPEVLEPAEISELSGVYEEYLLAHLLLPERKKLTFKIMTHIDANHCWICYFFYK